MKLHDPFIIGPRLLPAIKVGDVTLSLASTNAWANGRQIAKFIWDLPDGRTFADSTMSSPLGGFRGTVEIFETYLDFAYACKSSSESGENRDLFPGWLMDAIDSSDLDYLVFALQDEDGGPNETLIEWEEA